MVSYAQLWAADPAAWRATGVAWRALAGTVAERAREVAERTGALRAGWRGAAGEAAGGHLDGLSARLLAGRPGYLAVDQLLAEYAAELSRARALLEAAVSATAHTPVTIDRHGHVGLELAGERPDGGEVAAAARVAGGIRAALEVAASADALTAHRLEELAADAARGWPATPPPSYVPPVADPIAVRRWWAALTPPQRRWLLLHQPGAVGPLDGVPVAARDQANRLLLAGLAERIESSRAALAARLPGRAPLLPEWRRLAGLEHGVGVVADRLTVPDGSRVYLLDMSLADGGRAIVAIDDPDRTDNVVTYVPGMGAGLDGVARELDRAQRMVERAGEFDPTRRTAGVLWLGYDAPDFIDEAARTSYAQQAAPVLHRFQEGLRATHDGPPAHHTVVGHSYGSLVVGTAARDLGLAADDLVFVGSPGAGVGHASELRVPPERVWSSTAAHDPVQYLAPSPTQLGLDTLRAAASPAARLALAAPDALLALAAPDTHLWHGHNPSDPAFGGRVFASDPGPIPLGGHGDYWRRGNPALDSIARIALGGEHLAHVR